MPVRKPWSARLRPLQTRQSPRTEATPCLQRDDVFAPRQHDPSNRDHVHSGNRVPNDREGILSNLAIRSDVVGGVDVAVVDLTSRNELIDFDRPSAFDLHGIDLLVFHNEVTEPLRLRTRAPCPLGRRPHPFRDRYSAVSIGCRFSG